MVKVSVKAAEELKEIMRPGELLRMYLTPTKYENRHRFVAVVAKEAKPGDTVIESKGIKVAYDPAFEEALKPLVIDMAQSDESEGGERFCVWNPALRRQLIADPAALAKQTVTVAGAPTHSATGPEESVQQYGTTSADGTDWNANEAPKDCGCDCDECTCGKQE